jgi:hypothetical protein
MTDLKAFGWLGDEVVNTKGANPPEEKEAGAYRWPKEIINKCREVARALEPKKNNLTYRAVLDHPRIAEIFKSFGKSASLDAFKKWMRKEPKVHFNSDPGVRAQKSKI